MGRTTKVGHQAGISEPRHQPQRGRNIVECIQDLAGRHDVELTAGINPGLILQVSEDPFDIRRAGAGTLNCHWHDVYCGQPVTEAPQMQALMSLATTDFQYGGRRATAADELPAQYLAGALKAELL